MLVAQMKTESEVGHETFNFGHAVRKDFSFQHNENHLCCHIASEASLNTK